jgi:hypothetical protein
MFFERPSHVDERQMVDETAEVFENILDITQCVSPGSPARRKADVNVSFVGRIAHGSLPSEI